MKDYIEREAVLELLRKWADGYSYIEIEAASAIRGITAIPTADVKPVARGKWEWNKDNGYYFCSQCGAASPREDQNGEYCDCPKFCPNCGSYNGGDGDDQH